MSFRPLSPFGVDVISLSDLLESGGDNTDIARSVSQIPPLNQEN